MKQRLIKKWINRYIAPHIKGLPTTQTRTVEVKTGEWRGSGIYTYIDRNHTVINGKVTPEGEMIFPCENLRLNIQRTGEALRQIIADHTHVYLRIGPHVRENYVHVRLITE